MITYTSVDCSDCLCEILEESEGYTCSFSDKKKMNQKAKLVKPTRNVGDCEGGADCGDGWCCYNPDYPVCCPDTPYYTNWCGSTADGCPSSNKQLPKMAAEKKQRRLNMDLKTIAKNEESMKEAVARIQVQQDDCTEDCGYEIMGTALVCAAYYSDEDDWIDCMITYTSLDCSDCLCEILEESEGYTCSFTDKKKMNQKAKLVKPTKNVGACEGGADCGDGWCCFNPDYPVCCPDTDFYTNWCAVDFDSCADLSKTLPKMAAKKKVDLKNIDNKEDALRAAAAKIQIQQDDCTEDCGYEILGTALICGAYYSDEDDWIDCMITYTSYDCFDCLCELLDAEEG